MKVTHIIIIALVGVILYLSMCKGSRVVEVPIVKSDKEQKETVKRDEAYIKHIIDSINTNIINPTEEKADKWHYELVKTQQELIEQQDVFNTWINEHPEDSALRKQFEKLQKTSINSQTLCNKTIYAKDRIIGQKNVVIANKDSLYSKLKANYDTSLLIQKTLKDYATKVSPKHEVYIGATYMGGVPDLFSGIGVNLGYKTKQNVMIEVGAMITQGMHTQYTLGMKKMLFKF